MNTSSLSRTFFALFTTVAIGLACDAPRDAGSEGTVVDSIPSTAGSQETTTVAVSPEVPAESTNPGTLGGDASVRAKAALVSVAPERVRFASTPAVAARVREATRKAEIRVHIAPSSSTDACAGSFEVLEFTATEKADGQIELGGQTSASLTDASLDAVLANDFVFCFRVAANFAGTVEVRDVDITLTAPAEPAADGDTGTNGIPPDGDVNTNGTLAPPEIACPPDAVVECTAGGNEAELTAWLGAVSAVSTCGTLVVSDDFDGLTDDCASTGFATVTWTAVDDCGTNACTSSFTIVDTTAPTLTVPADASNICSNGEYLAALNDWLASASADDACGEVELTNDFVDLAGACDAVVKFTAVDDCGNVTTNSASVVIDSEPPAITVNGPVAPVLECNVDVYEELGATVVDVCDTDLAAGIGGDVIDVSSTGTYVVTYSATDACGNDAAIAERTVTVSDTLPPRIEASDQVELWPPNHKYVTLRLSDCAVVVDECEGELDVNTLGQIVSIYSDEPQNANSNGDGNTTEDIVIVDDSTFMLRAERQGGGNGRVYVIAFEVADSVGNVAELECSAGVPHDQSGAAPVNDGAGAGYTVTAE